MLLVVLFILAVLSAVLHVWQWYAGRRFPLHQTRAGRFSPPLSILRPVKGCDTETERCLESWFLQDYAGEYELLFGVASEKDPVCALIQGLIERYPSCRAELVVCKPLLGPNAKVSSLCYLAKQARHEHVVISDQDVLVSRHFLANLLPGIEDETVGLVNCFYILAEPRGAGMWLEVVAVNADFWTQVLQGNMLKPMDFALGAVMATTKRALNEIGGFEVLLDYLADDYQLGNRIARTGLRLELCRVPVECRSEPQSASMVWKHQLRWARTIRVCQPAPYFFSILNNATFWPSAYAAIALSRPAFVVWLAAMGVRVLTAASNYGRLAGKGAWKAGFLAPIKDLMQVPLWMLAFAGNKITWRDQRFRVDKGGKLTPLA